jgi:hypothetical protein
MRKTLTARTLTVTAILAAFVLGVLAQRGGLIDAIW